MPNALSLPNVVTNSWRLFATVSLLAFVSFKAFGQITPSFVRLTPPVIRSTETQPILLEAHIGGNPTRVALDFVPAGSQALLDLRDDGTNGDQRAGDSIYSIRLTVAQLIQNLQANDIFRRDFGFLRIFQGTTLNASINLSAAFATPDLPAVNVTRLAADAQCSDYVINLVVPAFFNATQSASDLNAVSRRFYQLFPDDYDMLNLATATHYIQNRFHASVKNNVQGIGQTINDRSAATGSAGRLLAFNVFPNIAFFDGANTGFVHEIGHQWIQFMQVAPFASGIPHWPYSSMATGVMGFSLPGSGAGGTYNCRIVPEAGGLRLMPNPAPKVFTDLDLYLMGLLAAEQVGDNYVFANQSDTAFQQCNGQLYTSGFTRVRASDVIAAFGPRVPNAATAPKEFRLATIIVTPNALLSQEAMAYFDFYTRRAEATQALAIHEGLGKGIANPFFAATGGRGKLITRLGTPKAASFTTVTATHFVGGMLAGEAIASAFGTNLSNAIVAATTLPLPTTLNGTTVRVRDSAGTERDAPLFFVSPQQVNFLIPSALALGNATLTITNGSNTSTSATTLVPVAPGLFSASATGQGVAAAALLRVSADGVQRYEPVASYDQANNRFVAVPINFGASTDQLFLILFGSGLRGVSALNAVGCTIGGSSAAVLYAGAQGELAGLDQINVSLPHSLAGRGEVDVIVTVEGKTTNAVKINLR